MGAYVKNAIRKKMLSDFRQQPATFDNLLEVCLIH